MKKIFFWIIAPLMLGSLVASCNNTKKKNDDKDLNINVMSFNVRYDNPEDSLNNWQYRKDIVAQVIKDADVVGTQEVLYNQLEDLKTRLPEYEALGVGREDGKTKGEYSALFYKKTRFDTVESGHFWLSETPDIAGSKGWDGACERMATWAKLEDKTTKQQLLVINTHLDHVGKVAREEGITLIIEQASKLANGLPVILTGDFNAEPNSDVIKHVLSDKNTLKMNDSRSIATTQENKGGEYTFHGFGEVPVDKREFIDYIFVSENISVNKYSVLDEKLNGVYVSDHRPVVASITIK